MTVTDLRTGLPERVHRYDEFRTPEGTVVRMAPNPFGDTVVARQRGRVTFRKTVNGCKPTFTDEKEHYRDRD